MRILIVVAGCRPVLAFRLAVSTIIQPDSLGTIPEIPVDPAVYVRSGLDARVTGLINEHVIKTRQFEVLEKLLLPVKAESTLSGNQLRCKNREPMKKPDVYEMAVVSINMGVIGPIPDKCSFLMVVFTEVSVFIRERGDRDAMQVTTTLF